MKLWWLTILYAFCSSAGLLLIKSGFNIQKGAPHSLWQLERLWYILTGVHFLLGFILYVIGFLIWLYILSKNDLSIAFPVASGVLYIGLLIGSILWLQEGVGVMRVSGVFLIFIGIILVSRS